MRGRPKNPDPPIGIHVNIPQSIKVEVDLLLFDPTTECIPKGSYTTLISSLLSSWVAEKKKETIDHTILENFNE